MGHSFYGQILSVEVDFPLYAKQHLNHQTVHQEVELQPQIQGEDCKIWCEHPLALIWHQREVPIEDLHFLSNHQVQILEILYMDYFTVYTQFVFCVSRVPITFQLLLVDAVSIRSRLLGKIITTSTAQVFRSDRRQRDNFGTRSNTNPLINQ